VSAELRDALCKVNEFCERVERLEQIANDTESNLVGVLDKVEALEGVVAAQEENFNKRLTDVLALVSAQANQSQIVVAELCAKVQSQEAQLQKLMDEREAAPVEVESSTVVTGTPATRSMLSRAAKAVGISG
jgi:ABC-type transporter Mla subunit MlaD